MTDGTRADDTGEYGFTLPAMAQRRCERSPRREREPRHEQVARCAGGAPEHDRDIRCRLPDLVLHTQEQDRAPGSWQSGAHANEPVMMQSLGVGPFIRSLLPVRLTGGYRVTFGVWVSVSFNDL